MSDVPNERDVISCIYVLDLHNIFKNRFVLADTKAKLIVYTAEWSREFAAVVRLEDLKI